MALLIGAVLIGASLIASSQPLQRGQKPAVVKKKPIVVKKTTVKTGPVVVKKTTQRKGSLVVKKTTTKSTTKTTTTVVLHAKSHKVAKHAHHRIVRRHRHVRHRYVRRRSHYRTTVASHYGAAVPSQVETGLVGVHLFDSGMKLLDMYGIPNEILPLGAGGGGAAPAGPPPPGPGGAPGGGGLGGGAGDLGHRRAASAGGPAGGGGWNFEDESLGQSQGQDIEEMPYQGGGPLFQTNDQNRAASAGGQRAGAAPSSPGEGAPGSSVVSVPGPPVQFLRWVYKRPNARYSFIIDHFNRVVQIEVVGMDDPRVRTRKGVTFGANFAELLRTYGPPDSYEIAGESMTMRYLSKNKIAFRLNRLQTDKPQVVTAMVVTAGKG